MPAPGEIVTAADTWEEPAGGGAVAAGELVRLGAEVDFFVAVGNDELGSGRGRPSRSSAAASMPRRAKGRSDERSRTSTPTASGRSR